MTDLEMCQHLLRSFPNEFDILPRVDGDTLLVFYTGCMHEVYFKFDETGKLKSPLTIRH
jgi:hypothetical protein